MSAEIGGSVRGASATAAARGGIFGLAAGRAVAGIGLPAGGVAPGWLGSCAVTGGSVTADDVASGRGAAGTGGSVADGTVTAGSVGVETGGGGSVGGGTVGAGGFVLGGTVTGTVGGGGTGDGTVADGTVTGANVVSGGGRGSSAVAPCTVPAASNTAQKPAAIACAMYLVATAIGDLPTRIEYPMPARPEPVFDDGRSRATFVALP